MTTRLARHGALVGVCVLLVTGCSATTPDEEAAGPGMSDLAPSYAAQPHSGEDDTRPKRRRRAADGSAPAEEPPAEAGQPVVAEVPPATPRPEPRRPAAPSGPVRVTDASGDLSSSLEGSPLSADILAVELDRVGGVVEVRTSFAGAVPTRQSGNKSMNVASFYDVDGNGIIDYEIWASLADDGWGTGHLDRREQEATFGPSTRVEVTVDGSTLVTTFPVGQIGTPGTFRWSAASEWGSYESMAASTSARDYAPDDGAVRYPG